MKKLILATLAIVSLLVLPNCKKEKSGPLEFSTNQVIIKGSSATPLPPAANFQLEAKNSWTASSDQEWCTISPKEGSAGTAFLTASGTTNDTGKDREATLTFTTEGATRSIRVTQQAIPTIDARETEFTVSAAGELITIYVFSNIDLSNFEEEYANHIIGDNVWFLCYFPQYWLKGKSANGDITISPNRSTKDRKGRFIIKEKNGGGARVVINITQKGRPSE